MTFKDRSGVVKRRKVLKSLLLETSWGVEVQHQMPTSRMSSCGGGYLARCGYSRTVRHICDINGWYSMVIEVLQCNACRVAEKTGSHKLGRFLAWDAPIMAQLSPARQAFFPAVLTPKRGLDKTVLRLLRDRTEGNTLSKVWRQVRESLCEDYLSRKAMYTTLLASLSKEGSIVREYPKTRKPWVA